MKELCNPDPKNPFKCWSGKQGKEKGKPMRARIKKSKDDGEDPIKTEKKMQNMNVRDLGANPGDVMLQKDSSSESFKGSQENVGKKLEIKSTETREYFNNKKGKNKSNKKLSLEKK